MEFWGLEVKSGASMKVQPGEGKILHISQACLGEAKKDKANDYVRVNVEMNDQKFVIGILSLDRFPNLNLDLVFEDEFKLSHDSKQGSVHFSGYRADTSAPVNDDESDDDEELVPIDVFNNGKPEAKDLQPSGSKANAGVKIVKTEDKSKVKIVEPGEDARKNVEDGNTDDEDDSDDDDDDESADNDEDKGEDMAISGSDEEDDSDEEDSDEETPMKPEPVKKRPGESTSKTPVSEKKARFSTPQQKTECWSVNSQWIHYQMARRSVVMLLHHILRSTLGKLLLMLTNLTSRILPKHSLVLHAARLLAPNKLCNLILRRSMVETKLSMLVTICQLIADALISRLFSSENKTSVY